MDYCPNCGGLLRLTKKNGKNYLACRRCGYSKPAEQLSGYSSRRIIEEAKHSRIGVIEEKDELKRKLREEAKEISEERRRELMDLLNREEGEVETQE